MTATAAPAHPSALPVPVRSGGPAFVVSGVLLIAAVGHPDILDGDVGHVVQDSARWAWIHYLTFGSIVAGWWGIVCAITMHRARLDRWADLTLIVATLGAFVLAAVMFTEAAAFPAIAEQAPGLLELDGPVMGSLSFRMLSAVGGGYLAGLVLLGVLCVRARVWSAPGAALSAATVGFMALAGPFVPVLGTLSVFALGLVLVWWGRLLWTAGSELS